MKDIDHWLDSLTGQNNNHTPEDVSAETDMLKTILAKEYEEQQTSYQTRAKQDWPDLLNRLKKEKLLDEPKKSPWFSNMFRQNWKLHFSAGAAVAATVLAIVFFSPRQPPLEPQISESYTLYPHYIYRGGQDTVHPIQTSNPDVYIAEILTTMNKHQIPFKLDRLPTGWQLEYLLPDTLSATATNTIMTWTIPREQGIWHVVQIMEKK